MSNQDPTAPDFGADDAPKYPPPPPASGSYPSYPPPPAGGAAYPPPPAGGAAYPPGPSDAGAPIPPSYAAPAGNPYAAPPMSYPSGGGNPYVAGGTALPGGGPVPPMSTRFLARLIDGIVFMVAWFVLGTLGVGAMSLGNGSNAASGLAFGAMVTTLLLFGAIGLLYEVVLIALRGATIGKQVMGLKVVMADSGAIPGWGPSIIRWGVPTLASLLCGIGQLVVYLSPFWADPTGRQRGYHDQAANTVVISTR